MNSFLLALALAALPAFPGAQGFGSTTVGGSGRHLTPPATTVYRVKSLNDAGPETLRECVDASGPRVCIFETSGIIVLKSNLRVLQPYLTIAGETAPAPGIMLRNAELGVLTHDVVVRHLHVRAGDDPAGSDPGSRGGLGYYGDAPSTPGCYNVIADHMSLSWSVDELVDTWYTGVHDITLSNSLIAEPLYASIHPSGPQGTNFIIGEDAKNVSVVRNLFAHGFSRNPYAKSGNIAEWVNNTVYHWGYGMGGNNGSWAMTDLSDYDHIGKPSFWNFLGNYYKCGADSECNFPPIFSQSGADLLNPQSYIYVKGNIGPGRTSDTGDEWAICNGLAKPEYCTSAPAVKGSSVTAIPAMQAYTELLSDAGAFPKWRDWVDQRIISEVQAGTGQFQNCVSPDGSTRCEKNAGGWPPYPVTTVTHVLPANPNNVMPSGYTALEEWIQGFPKAPLVPLPTPTPTAVPTPVPTYPPCQ